MHLAVTTRFLLPGGHLEGLGRYTFETLRCLVAQHPECTFHFLFDRPCDPRYLLGPNVVAHVLLPPARHVVLLMAWYEVAVAHWLRRHRPAALLSPEGFTVLNTSVPRVMVWHDLAYLHRPQDVSGLIRRYYAWFAPRWARAAAQLVAVSDTTRQDMARQYGLPAARILVASNAPAAHFAPQPAAAQAATRQRFSQGQPYFLFVGALQPRKNLANLLRAFGQFRAEGGRGRRRAPAAGGPRGLANRPHLRSLPSPGPRRPRRRAVHRSRERSRPGGPLRGSAGHGLRALLRGFWPARGRGPGQRLPGAHFQYLVLARSGRRPRVRSALRPLPARRHRRGPAPAGQ
ncbi:MAG: glycosyltransferase [Hymenobacter sp.]